MKTETKFAGFWVRFVANSLDQIVLGLPIVFILGQIIPFFIDFETIKSSVYPDVELVRAFLQNVIFIEIIAVILWAAFMSFFVIGKWQASPGKRFMGIYIMRRDGSQPRLLESFLRFASLPMVMLLSQIFARDEIYSKLGELGQNPAQYEKVEDMVRFLSASSVVAYSDLIAFVIAAVWLLMAGTTREKTALHDILFDTRVVYGKK